MHHIADIVNKQSNKPGHETCKQCGLTLIFSENQWRQRCPGCGIVITLHQSRVLRKKEQVRNPACFMCHDVGLIEYWAQDSGNLNHYVARCNCRFGQERPEKSIPLAADCLGHMPDLRWLAQKNLQEWEKKHGPVNRLLDDSVEVDAEEVPFRVNAK